jgi:hypothetical protein
MAIKIYGLQTLASLFSYISLSAVIFASCSDTPLATRPLCPINLKDRYGFWLHQYPGWFRFDRNCRLTYDMDLGGGVLFLDINPTTGEFWAKDSSGNLYIYDADGRHKRLAGTYPGLTGHEFDTNAEVVWAFDTDGFIKKLDYDGRLILEKTAPEDLRIIKAYEKTGDVWAVNHYGSPSLRHLHKFDSNGDLVFSKAAVDLGFPDGTDFYDLFVDQTDGGIWLMIIGNFGGSNLFKFDADANPIPTPTLLGRILYTDNKTGDVLIKASDSSYAYLCMHDKFGNLRWFVYNEYDFGDSAFISEYDGSVIFTEQVENKAPFSLGKISRNGEWLIREIPIKQEGRLKYKREPYPY